MFDPGCQDKLCEYDLDVNLFKKFDLYVYEVLPMRKAFVLCTDKGNKILKKINYSIDDLKFIYNALNYINRNFKRTMSFEKTLDGEIYTLWNKDMYFIMDLVKGRESEFSNPLDVSIVSKSLASFHKAGEGISSFMNFESKNNCGKLIENLKRKKEEMIFFKNIANWCERKNEFDINFLENVDYNIKEAQKSIDVLENSSYYKLCGETEKVVLCHHDLAHHNIIIKEDEGYFIDFDYSMIDLRVHDLCNYINKAIKNVAYDKEKAMGILKDYNKINPIDERELEVLYGMFIFPEDFYSICKDYYGKRKDWNLDTFISKLEKKIDISEDKDRFIYDFSKLI